MIRNGRRRVEAFGAVADGAAEAEQRHVLAQVLVGVRRGVGHDARAPLAPVALLLRVPPLRFFVTQARQQLSPEMDRTSTSIQRITYFVPSRVDRHLGFLDWRQRLLRLRPLLRLTIGSVHLILVLGCRDSIEGVRLLCDPLVAVSFRRLCQVHRITKPFTVFMFDDYVFIYV